MAGTTEIIHLVDDDPNVRATLARLIRSGGFDVREYGSGAELLSSIGNPGNGCIILDIDMPGEDGFSVRRALADRGIDIPVVMMTGSGDLTIAALRAGASEFMQKPFGRGEILDVIHDLTALALHD